MCVCDYHLAEFLLEWEIFFRQKLHRKSEHISNSLFPENRAFYEVKGKGKAVPLQAWGGQEGSRKLRFPDFMTTAQDGGKVVSLTHRPPLTPGNTPDTHFC